MLKLTHSKFTKTIQLSLNMLTKMRKLSKQLSLLTRWPCQLALIFSQCSKAEIQSKPLRQIIKLKSRPRHTLNKCANAWKTSKWSLTITRLTESLKKTKTMKFHRLKSRKLSPLSRSRHLSSEKDGIRRSRRHQKQRKLDQECVSRRAIVHSRAA